MPASGRGFVGVFLMRHIVVLPTFWRAPQMDDASIALVGLGMPITSWFKLRRPGSMTSA